MNKKIPLSRRLWGWFVFSLGILWTVGGTFAIFQAQLMGWLWLFCGIVLCRLGYNLTRDGSTK